MVFDNDNLPTKQKVSIQINPEEIVYYPTIDYDATDISFTWCNSVLNSIVYECNLDNTESYLIKDSKIEVKLIESIRDSGSNPAKKYEINITDGIITFEDDSATNHTFEIESKPFTVTVYERELE
jgi:hypothetical protein